MANEEHVAILKLGVEVWNQWRQRERIAPDLRWADLRDSHLAGIDFRYAKLNCVDFRGADLTDADFLVAAVIQANLSMANLTGANLYNAWVSDSNFSDADLSFTDLRLQDISGADFSRAILNGAILDGFDLTQAKGLETVVHRGPSTVGIELVYRSGGNIPEVFLRGAGVPENFITFMKSLTGQAFDFYSCFISHSSKDKAFVERLYADLQSNGVRCWYAPEDLKIGEPFVLGIDQGIRLHDKLLLVLSEQSVNSGWVQHEVLSAMAKEQGKAPWVLFPIRLDNAVLETTVPWATMIRQSRHIGDFRGWKEHDSYRQAFARLLRDLKGQGRP